VIPARVPVLHALTNDTVLADPGFVQTATTVMRACGNQVAVHVRGSGLTAHRLLELVLELHVVSEQTGSWVLVADRVDVALVSGCTGAQLTSRSLTLADARRIAPTIVLGASVHSARDAWLSAQSGATFLVAGQVAADTQRADQFLSAVVDASGACPVILVGGVTPERAGDAARGGATGIAAMRGIWFDDAVVAARRYLAAYDEGLRS
jgi:thiamine-phosphate pyrophosphorylase